MAVETEKSGSDGKVWSFCRMPFWQGRNGSSSSSSSLSSMHNIHAHHHHQQQQNQSHHQSVERLSLQSPTTVSSVAKSFLPTRRRLRLDPPSKLFFPCKNKLFCSWLLHLIFLFLFCISLKQVFVSWLI
uniref:Uncharacterized protein n=1 Tax=Cannabis sativa TaxID=3483 RepID=A0A803RB85_CANSA